MGRGCPQDRCGFVISARKFVLSAAREHPAAAGSIFFDGLKRREKHTLRLHSNDKTFMKLNSPLLLAAGILVLAGCSSTPTHVDTGPIHAKTFSFVNRGNRPAPGYADERQAVHTMIQDAITKNLAGHGITKVDAGGDVTVGYLVIIGNNVSTTMISEYFGYGQNAVGLQEKAQKAYTSYDSPNYFEAGTLVIDIIDTRTNELLKRGYAVRSTLKNLPEDQKAARIQEAVDEILGDLKVAQ